jgi:ABC-type multidrug transport system ATPase subunit
MNVELTDLTRRFGRNKAVAGVNLETGPGVFGLLGPNGAGKTSLLRMMATVIPPSSGRIRLLGRDPGSYEPRREIRRRLGYLPQALGYYPGFTVLEFVEYFALLKDMPAARVPAAVATAVERVDLGLKAKAKLRTLSGGMLRRVGIAQAIVNEPELLLLDEPTAGLDPEQRVAFRALLRDLGQRATVVVSTHLVEDVGAACTEVALMDAGKIVFHGTPAELTSRGTEHGTGDAPMERGYTAVLAAARSCPPSHTSPGRRSGGYSGSNCTATHRWRARRCRRPPHDSARCRPRPGMPGSRLTWPPCGPAASPWRSCRERHRAGDAATASAHGGLAAAAAFAPREPTRPGGPRRPGRVRRCAAGRAEAALDPGQRCRCAAVAVADRGRDGGDDRGHEPQPVR